MSDPEKKRILVVDDSPTIVAAVSGALKGFFKTKVAKSGEKALAIANGPKKPDLILLDVMLPDINGFEVCRRLKEKPETSDIPVIFLTGKTDPSDEVKGFEVGGSDYIRKPFPAEVIVARVKTQLALKAALEDAKTASLEHSFMSSEALSNVLRSMTPIELQPEEILLRKGEESDAAYYLHSGYLRVYEDTRYGPVTLAKLKSPRLIGEIGALAGIPRTASVKALTEACVYRISRAQLFKLSRKSPELLMAVVGQLGQQINSVGAAVALYTNALAALERQEFDKEILDDLSNPPQQLGEFASTFRRFAEQILTKQRQQEEIASAALIQRSFLPERPPLEIAAKGIELEGKIRPARAVGGDFYDFFMLDEDRLAVVIGDVCGKGIPASLFMAVVVTVLRTAAREAENAAATIERANAILCRNNAASLFATVFYAVLNLTDGTLEYCNCGHTPPVLISASGEGRRLPATGIPLALYADFPAPAATAPLDPGDTLLLFTDGVTEALNPAKEQFGDALLLETLRHKQGVALNDVVTHLFDTVDRFAAQEPQADDITCVAIRRA